MDDEALPHPTPAPPSLPLPTALCVPLPIPTPPSVPLPQVDALEDEIGDEVQARLALKTKLEQEAQLRESAQSELAETRERQTRRQHILPEGVQDLQDALDMANDVRQTLTEDIAKLTEELVEVKLERAHDFERREELERQLKRAGEHGRKVAERMTHLEVKLAEVQSAGAETEESIAAAFKEVINDQEAKILQLQQQLASR